MKIGKAYGIPSFSVTQLDDLALVRNELDKAGPAIFEVFLDVDQEFEPRAALTPFAGWQNSNA